METILVLTDGPFQLGIALKETIWALDFDYLVLYSILDLKLGSQIGSQIGKFTSRRMSLH